MAKEFEKPERYSLPAAEAEAAKLKAKIESGEARDYEEAERLVDEEALYEAINDCAENAEFAFFNSLINVLKRKKRPASEIALVEADFHEFMAEQRKLINTLGGNYQLGALRQKIPGNQFLKIIEQTGSILSKNIGLKQELKDPEIRRELGEYIRGKAEKKKRGLDRN
jgi:hypothetical protein